MKKFYLFVGTVTHMKPVYLKVADVTHYYDISSFRCFIDFVLHLKISLSILIRGTVAHPLYSIPFGTWFYHPWICGEVHPIFFKLAGFSAPSDIQSNTTSPMFYPVLPAEFGNQGNATEKSLSLVPSSSDHEGNWGKGFSSRSEDLGRLCQAIPWEDLTFWCWKPVWGRRTVAQWKHHHRWSQFQSLTAPSWAGNVPVCLGLQQLPIFPVCPLLLTALSPVNN